MEILFLFQIIGLEIFKKRKVIASRTPPMKSQERIDAENYSHLKEFYLLLEGIYKKHSFSPARIFNDG